MTPEERVILIVKYANGHAEVANALAGITETELDTSVVRAAPRQSAEDLGVYVKSRRAQTNVDYETWVHADVAPTLNAFDIGSSRSVVQVAEQDSGTVRRLTPLEHERLQGFPDDHTRWMKRADGKVREQSDSRRYAQIGNAVAVTVVRELVRRISMYQQ